MKLKIIAIITLLFIESLSGSQYRKGLYARIGAGYRNGGILVPVEIGYGVTNNLLISLSQSSSISLITDNLKGIGVSYYVNDKLYVQIIAGKSYLELDDSTLDDGLGFSLGAGIITSMRASWEVSYLHLDFDNAQIDGKNTDNISEPLDVFGIAFKYRLF